MARGDHIFVRRPLLYTHHGIDCGDGTVIHYTGELGSKTDAAVRRSLLADFVAGAEEVRIQEYEQCDPAGAVVERAESRLDERDYSLVFNNCEHFAYWCKTGKKRSRQVAYAAKVAAGLAVAVVGGAAVAILKPAKGKR